MTGEVTGPVFDFGSLSPDDIASARAKADMSGYSIRYTDSESLSEPDSYGRMFLAYVLQMIEVLDINPDDVSAGLPVGQVEDMSQLLREAWDQKAATWIATESPTNYMLTFQTLLENLKLGKKQETIVSLGSGPALYEAYLGTLLQATFGRNAPQFWAVDFSPEMTRIAQAVVAMTHDHVGKPVRAVRPVTGDMQALQFPSRFADQIICNNSLQWVSDWKKAIAEMERIMNPKGLGYLYLFVNNHPMKITTVENEELFQLGDIPAPELLDTLEEHRFKILNTRQIATGVGGGQLGGQSDRLFIRARYKKSGTIPSWRDARVSGSIVHT